MFAVIKFNTKYQVLYSQLNQQQNCSFLALFYMNYRIFLKDYCVNVGFNTSFNAVI